MLYHLNNVNIERQSKMTTDNTLGIRNPIINTSTYIRMIDSSISQQTGSFKSTRIIVPVSIKDSLITHYEAKGFKVLPQWYDGIDEHTKAVYLTLWLDTSVDFDIPVTAKYIQQYGEIADSVSSAMKNHNDGSLSLGH